MLFLIYSSYWFGERTVKGVCLLLCCQACEVAGYSIAKDQAVVFISFTANRDSAVFPEANRFRPERWSNE